MHRMSGGYIKLQDEAVEKDKKIADMESQLNTMGAQVMEARNKLKELMDKNTATFAMQIRDRDYDNSKNAKGG